MHSLLEAENRKNGKLPGCVEICPKEALTFGTREKLIELARQRTVFIRTDTSIIFTGSMKWAARAGFICLPALFADLGMREDLGVTPAPAPHQRRTGGRPRGGQPLDRFSHRHSRHLPQGTNR
ncbi:MAG: hypothetical protein R2860_12775 [Desulfobacterales bacterium]